MGVYEGNKPYIFISYAHKDTARVIPAIHALRNRGFRVWFDSGIEAGSEWPAIIEKHVLNCAVLLVFMTNSTVESQNCRNEINLALTKTKNVLVVYLEETELKYGMELQLSSSQSLFAYRHKTQESFINELCAASLLQCCGDAADATADDTAAGTQDPSAISEKQKDFQEQLVAAERGNAKAQYRVGYCYEHGIGVEQDTLEAISWYRRAAKRFNADAQCRLGYCYEQGIGLKADAVHAVYWYRKAAWHRHAEAQCRLGNYYQDQFKLSKAVKWYRKAAKQNHAEAHYRLGECIEHDVRVPFNSLSAAEWYSKAAKLGYIEAGFRLGVCYRNGIEVEQSDRDAFKWFRYAALQDHPEALYYFGRCYEEGRGVSKSETDAFALYQQAAASGSASAQYRLGFFCEHGIGVEKDLQTALGWYQKAADADVAEAQFRLADLYEHGIAVTQDDRKALELYRCAASQGHAQSRFRLGYRYLHGIGVEQNETQAVLYFYDAAQQGHVDAQYYAAYCFENFVECLVYYEKHILDRFFRKDLGEIIHEYYTSSAEGGNADAQYRMGCMDKKMSRTATVLDWFYKAALQDHPAAQFELAECYANGFGVGADIAKALEWYHKAADNGSADAQYRLGGCFESGNGVEADPAQAMVWYHKAADNGSADAQYRLGCCFESGNGVEADPAQAMVWYHKAAENGSVDAQKQLQHCYEDGIGVAQDAEQAFYWFCRSAENADADTQFEVGCRYEEREDFVNAAKWYSKAAEYRWEVFGDSSGCIDAHFRLGLFYLHGLGVKQDEQEAGFYFHVAAEKGHTDAQYYAAYCWEQSGRSPMQKTFLLSSKHRQLFDLYAASADGGNIDAQYRLAQAYEQGDLTGHDLDKAIEWYQKAAAQGHAQAQAALARLQA